MKTIDLYSKEYQSAKEKFISKLKQGYPDAFVLQEKDQNFSKKTAAHLNRSMHSIENSRKSLTPRSGNLNKEELKHLLRRIRLTVRKSELSHFLNKPLEEIVGEWSQKTTLSTPINKYAPEVSDDHIGYGESIVDGYYVSGEVEGRRILTYKIWVMENCFKSDPSFTTVMWMFLQSILVVQLYDVYYAKGTFHYLKLLHDYALGNYKELIKKITVDDCMLVYLNGARNHKWEPDENYARELQELFCIGKGPGAGYNEQDVQQAARVLTGHKWVDYMEGTTFEPEYHDTEDKQFSSFYGNKVIKGRSGNEAKDEYLELIDMIFDNEESSKYICRRLYNYFVYPTIDDWTDEHIISELAKTFRENNYELLPVIVQLFSSEHFFDPIYFGAMIKTPMDAYASISSNMNLPQEKADLYEDFQYKSSTFWRIANLGMQLGDPPNVAGWPAYYQSPLYDKSWINTTTILRRIEVWDAMVWWGYWTPYGKEVWDLLAFTNTLENPREPMAIIDEMIDLFCGLNPPEEVKERLRSILLSGQNSDYYWTEAWSQYLQDPNNEELRNTVFYRLARFYQRFFQLEECQLK